MAVKGLCCAILVLFLYPLVSVADYNESYLSPVRKPFENFKQAVKRTERAYTKAHQASSFRPSLSGDKYLVTALNSAIPYAELNFNMLSDVKDLGEVIELFQQGRDSRFIPEEDSEKDLRRITWLYPQDGCYLRAHYFNRLLKEKKGYKLQKIFVFGDLKVRSSNVEKGFADWWYHVALIIRSGGDNWVLDPAVDPRWPLPLWVWLNKINQNERALEMSICDADTFSPRSDCIYPRSKMSPDRTLLRFQRGFLKPEKENLLRLGRNIIKELGDEPLWPKVIDPFDIMDQIMNFWRPESN